MITKDQFVKAIKFCQKIDSREEQFGKALQDFQGQKDFIDGFHSNTSFEILAWLSEVMNDKDDTISWWYYDAPHQGFAEEEVCTIRDTRDRVIAILKTPDDLYNYLVGEGIE